MSRVSTARSGASFLALACVGFIATAPTAHAADNDVSTPADADKDGQDRSAEDREQIVVTGGRAELQGPKATASVQNTPRSVVISATRSAISSARSKRSRTQGPAIRNSSPPPSIEPLN